MDIVKEREKNGEFKSLVDLLKRVSNSTLNKKILEALIYSNSLSSLENNQNFLIKKLEDIILFNVDYHKIIQKIRIVCFQKIMMKNFLTHQIIKI